MTIRNHLLRTTALALIATASCSDNPARTIDAGTPDAPPQSTAFHQVEHLARPGINEALLTSHDFSAGYNATAPSFAGVPAETLGAVAGQAKTTLKALYLGVCLLNGALRLTADTGLKPAGMTCHAVGGALWTENTLGGVTLTADSKAAAQAYADKVFDQFIPDVMRVDTSLPRSGYLSLCGTATSKPLLCGGRFLNDDVIDITYNYLLNGAGTTQNSPLQVRALTSDGVAFSMDDANNSGNVLPPDPTNLQQGHPNVSQAFPYSAAPF
jgi:hypothetical protein